MSVKVSIVMPVGCIREFLPCALRSVVRQTFREWELIVVDDGVEDTSVADTIVRFNELRIRYLRTSGGEGPAVSRNRALECVRGAYVAFMDADDIMLPGRLEEQVRFLERRADADVCAAFAMKVWTRNAHTYPSVIPRIMRPLCDSDSVAASLLFRNPLCFSSTMVRRTVFEEGYRFDPTFPVSGDYDFWARVLTRHRCAVIPRVLVWYRIHRDNLSSCRRSERSEYDRHIQRSLLRRLGLEAAPEDVLFAQQMHSGVLPLHESNIRRYADWMSQIEAANRRCQRYVPEALAAAIAWQWEMTCSARTKEEGLGALGAYVRYAALFHRRLRWRETAVMLAKSLLRRGEE